jgi:hypothetical protein
MVGWFKVSDATFNNISAIVAVSFSSSYYGDEIAMKDGVDGNMDPASRLPGQVCFVKMDQYFSYRGS